MKKYIILSISIIFMACEKEGDLTKSGAPIPVVSQNSTLKYKAVFMPTAGITASGEANIYLVNGQYKLELTNFNVTEGPDLKVYLSKSNTPSEFVSLGNLNSSLVYTISQTIDIAAYSYLLIHCQQYNHLFATAKIIQN